MCQLTHRNFYHNCTHTQTLTIPSSNSACTETEESIFYLQDSDGQNDKAGGGWCDRCFYGRWRMYMEYDYDLPAVVCKLQSISPTSPAYKTTIVGANVTLSPIPFVQYTENEKWANRREAQQDWSEYQTAGFRLAHEKLWLEEEEKGLQWQDRTFLFESLSLKKIANPDFYATIKRRVVLEEEGQCGVCLGSMVGDDGEVLDEWEEEEEVEIKRREDEEWKLEVEREGERVRVEAEKEAERVGLEGEENEKVRLEEEEVERVRLEEEEAKKSPEVKETDEKLRKQVERNKMLRKRREEREEGYRRDAELGDGDENERDGYGEQGVDAGPHFPPYSTGESLVTEEPIVKASVSEESASEGPEIEVTIEEEEDDEEEVLKCNSDSVVMLPCGHIFGASCIRAWFENSTINTTCPHCRHEFRIIREEILYPPGFIDEYDRYRYLLAHPRKWHEEPWRYWEVRVAVLGMMVVVLGSLLEPPPWTSWWTIIMLFAMTGAYYCALTVPVRGWAGVRVWWLVLGGFGWQNARGNAWDKRWWDWIAMLVVFCAVHSGSGEVRWGYWYAEALRVLKGVWIAGYVNHVNG